MHNYLKILLHFYTGLQDKSVLVTSASPHTSTYTTDKFEKHEHSLREVCFCLLLSLFSAVQEGSSKAIKDTRDRTPRWSSAGSKLLLQSRSGRKIHYTWNLDFCRADDFFWPACLWQACQPPAHLPKGPLCRGLCRTVANQPFSPFSFSVRYLSVREHRLFCTLCGMKGYSEHRSKPGERHLDQWRDCEAASWSEWQYVSAAFSSSNSSLHAVYKLKLDHLKASCIFVLLWLASWLKKDNYNLSLRVPLLESTREQKLLTLHFHVTVHEDFQFWFQVEVTSTAFSCSKIVNKTDFSIST